MARFYEILADEVLGRGSATPPDTLGELARDRAAVREGGQAARVLAESRYTWEQQAATVEMLLHEVVSA